MATLEKFDPRGSSPLGSLAGPTHKKGDTLNRGTIRGLAYVPSLYFLEGLPYILVNVVSVIMFKKMGLSNQLIGLTSWFYLPWVVKMFWAPMVDSYGTKRAWTVGTQVAMGVALVGVAVGLQGTAFLPVAFALFTVLAFISATHDVAVDGFYMLALSPSDQAFFTGIRSTFYRLAMMFGSGALVVFAGRLETSTENIPMSWAAAMGVAAGLLFVLGGFHALVLPRPASDAPGVGTGRPSWGEVFGSYFRQDRVGVLVAFILTYRLGEAFLSKMTAPFLLDDAAAGGLGLGTESVGLVYGTVGLASLVLGGVLGGVAIARYSLARLLWPMALALKAPDLVYVYMAMAKPSLEVIYPLVAFEQFGYGFGFTAFMVVLMYSASGPFKTSHFAISTGIMALGMMVPGLISGYAQSALGYLGFFGLVLVLTLPGLVMLFFLPQRVVEGDKEFL